MQTAIVLGILRHILTAGGGAIVAGSAVAPGDYTAEAIGGAVMTLAGFLWSLYDKKRK